MTRQANILVIIYSISKSLITRQATVLLTNASVFQAERVTASPLARGDGRGEECYCKLGNSYCKLRNNYCKLGNNYCKLCNNLFIVPSVFVRYVAIVLLI